MNAARILIGVFLLFASGCAAQSGTPPALTEALPSTDGTSVAAERQATTQPSPTASPGSASPTPPPPSPTVQPATPTTVPPSPTPAPPTPTPEPPPLDPALSGRLQTILEQTVANGSIPGVVLSVQVPGYQPWNGAAGLADGRQGQPMTPDTLVRVASISKIFTAVVVLQLVEEGKIGLDQPVATWLPELLPNGDVITVRHLLQHTTGLHDFLEDSSFINQPYRNPDRHFTPAELVGYAARFPPAFSPGSPGRWDYSSTNYVILGMIVEEVTGNTLGQEMRSRIFEPLALDQTFFAPDEAFQGVHARGYGGSADQTAVAMSFAYATANLVSSADDIRRFMIGLFAGELLQPETLEQMQQFVSGHGQYNMPALEYGLGLMRNVLPVGPAPDGGQRPASASTVVGHIGGFGGFRSAVWLDPSSGTVVSLGMNQALTDPNILATQVWDAILTWQGR